MKGFEIIVLLVFVVASHYAAASESVLVKTSQGTVSGYTDETIHGRKLYAFKGIPYAQPPVGKLRFKDPVPASPSDDVIDATETPPWCPQYLYELIVDQNWTTVIGSEDCLFLNVFSPKLIPDEGEVGLPVMVFFHGGAWLVGGASIYPPHALLDADIVLVIVQYRLGTLGFLSTEDEYAPGNLGIKDQSLALRWVQQHISDFGGDKDRVTIFGESAGGASSHYHMLSEHSRGLFHRAILQSGTATCPWASTTNPRATAKAIAKHLGCPTSPSADLMVRCMQKFPVEEIAYTYGLFFEHGMFPIKTAPYADGDFVKDHPAMLMKEGKHADVDVMMGVTKDEGAWFTTLLFSYESMFTELNKEFNKYSPVTLLIPSDSYKPLLQAIRIFKRYMGDNIMYAKQEDEITQMFGDRLFNVPSDNVAMSLLENGISSRVFKYEFEYRGQQSFVDLFPMTYVKNPEKLKKWVSHVDELAYLFPGSKLFKRHEEEGDKKMTDLMVKLWANFAATGNPTPDDGLGFIWEPSTKDNFQHLRIDSTTPAMGEDQRYVTRKFWNSYPLPENMMTNPAMFTNIVEEMARLEKEAQDAKKASAKDEL